MSVRHRVVMAVLLGCAVVVSTVLPASATYYSGGLGYGDFQIKPYSYNSTWQTPMDTAITSWNNLSGPANITKSSGAWAWVEADSYPDTWYGLYTPYFGYFRIQLNSRTISRDAGTSAYFWIRSTFAHELGHGLSLADNPPVTPSLMRHDRNRSTIYYPQSYDLSEAAQYN